MLGALAMTAARRCREPQVQTALRAAPVADHRCAAALATVRRSAVRDELTALTSTSSTRPSRARRAWTCSTDRFHPQRRDRAV